MNHSHYQPHLIINPWEGDMLQPTIVFLPNNYGIHSRKKNVKIFDNKNITEKIISIYLHLQFFLR